MKKIALLIGVSEYQSPELNPLPAAEMDVKAMQRILEHPQLGNFDEVKICINPTNPPDLEMKVSELFSKCKHDDLLLFYFSGHGIKDSDNEFYFTTCSTKMNSDRTFVSSSGFLANTIHRKMQDSRSKRQVIILDCCYSGAFALSPKSRDFINLKEQFGAEGRVVLASSSSTQYSYEQKGSEISIYTQYIVEGIETGKADIQKTGKISIEQLHDYAKEKVTAKLANVTPQMITLKDKGYDIIIAKNPQIVKQKPKINTTKIELGNIKIARSESRKTTYTVVPSLLSPLEPFIKNLIETLESYAIADVSKDRSPEIETIVLNIIRDSLKADYVFVMQSARENDSEWNPKAQSNIKDSRANEPSYAETIKTQILNQISLESIFAKGRRGIFSIDRINDIETASIVFPLNLFNEFLVVCNSSGDRNLWNDAHGRVISTFYQESLKFFLASDRVEAAILDELKKSYGFVPLSLYNRRLELFCDRLKEMIVYFEPILDLRRIKIWGWEALARDPKSQSAPVDLFNAAELWGRTFTLQLDIHFLQVAINSYHQALEKRQNNRIHEIRPLSVNVYPESLMQDEYFKVVGERVEDNARFSHFSKISRIPSDLLILEISEKAKLPNYQRGVRLENPINSFYERLTQYTHDFGIKFSIDDFGVGHASVSRLAGLNTPFVKIDREILHHKTAEVIFDFINDIVKKATPMNPAKVIVEGLDKDSPISLKKLNDLKIRYVQGYVIGKAKPEIYYFNDERIAELRNQILGESNAKN